MIPILVLILFGPRISDHHIRFKAGLINENWNYTIKEILKNHLDTYESNQSEIQKRVDANDLRQMLLEEIKNLNLINTTIENEQPISIEEKEEEEGRTHTFLLLYVTILKVFS